MAEITSEKSIKSARHLIEHLDVEKFIDYPDVEKFIDYQCAKNYIKCPGSLFWYPPAETAAVAYRSLPRSTGEREFMLSDLISKSKETRRAWDALNLIAQDLFRRKESLPPELAEWVADVLADQLAKTKRGQKRRPRPAKGAQGTKNRDDTLRSSICHLIRLFDLNATRNDGGPPLSACDVVAAVTKMPYKSVERIWNRRSPSVDSFLSRLDRQRLAKGYAEDFSILTEFAKA